MSFLSQHTHMCIITFFIWPNSCDCPHFPCNMANIDVLSFLWTLNTLIHVVWSVVGQLGTKKKKMEPNFDTKRNFPINLEMVVPGPIQNQFWPNLSAINQSNRSTNQPGRMVKKLGHRGDWIRAPERLQKSHSYSHSRVK